jgi:hypothetical protein
MLLRLPVRVCYSRPAAVQLRNQRATRRWYCSAPEGAGKDGGSLTNKEPGEGDNASTDAKDATEDQLAVEPEINKKGERAEIYDEAPGPRYEVNDLSATLQNSSPVVDDVTGYAGTTILLHAMDSLSVL